MCFENQNVAITTSSFYLLGDERTLDYNLTNSLIASRTACSNWNCTALPLLV